MYMVCIKNTFFYLLLKAYERTCPVYNGECIGKWDESGKVFENPKVMIIL